MLLSVFVPVAFIPGISGELFRQFAVTVAVAMFLSAINALTLSPALCGVLLRPHHGPRRGIIGWVMRSIDRVRDAYGAVVARLVRFSIIGLVLVAVVGVRRCGPREDHADRISCRRTTRARSSSSFSCRAAPRSPARPDVVAASRGDPAKEEPPSRTYTSVIGLNFIDNYSQPNAAFMVVTLKPFEERKDALHLASAR